MPVQGTFDPLRALGKDYVLLTVSATITASGVVASMAGKGFTTTTALLGDTLGSVARSAAGVYVVTLPGRGAVQDIVPLGIYIEDGAPADLKLPMVTAKSVSARTITITFFDALGDGTPAAEELTDGTIVHISLLVKNSSLG